MKRTDAVLEMDDKEDPVLDRAADRSDDHARHAVFRGDPLPHGDRICVARPRVSIVSCVLGAWLVCGASL